MDTLERTDRLTLRAARISNQLGWGAVALLLAVGFHSLVEAVVNRRLSGCCGIRSITLAVHAQDATATAGMWATRFGLSLALGTLIGVIAAEYVRTRPTRVATVVASVYAALAAFILWTATEITADQVAAPFAYLLLILVAIPTAWAWSRRRPG